MRARVLLLSAGFALAACHATPSRPTAVATPTAVPSFAVAKTPPPSPAQAIRHLRPAYVWGVRRLTAADLPHSWRPGCPVGPSQLRLLTLPYVGFDGRQRIGRIVVNATVVSQVVRVFRTLDAQRFPIRSLRPVDDFRGSDDASMAADNTSGFNCRQAVGGSGWSMHAYGLAVDVDPRENPYVEGDRVLPADGAPYVDRSRVRRGVIVRGGLVWRAFTTVGWGWGGTFASPDYQHFSANGK